jgi:hypothetical protein
MKRALAALREVGGESEVGGSSEYDRPTGADVVFVMDRESDMGETTSAADGARSGLLRPTARNCRSRASAFLCSDLLNESQTSMTCVFVPHRIDDRLSSVSVITFSS